MEKIFSDSISQLKSDCIILYPTDTVWGIGSLISSNIGIEKIYNLKKRESSKSIIILVSSLEMLERYISLNKNILEYIESLNTPTTIIYKNPKNINPKLVAKDNSIAIRIVSSGFAHQLINLLDEPITSTSANISGKSTPISFKEISSEILEGVDYIVPLQEYKSSNKSSKIITFDNKNNVCIIRD